MQEQFDKISSIFAETMRSTGTAGQLPLPLAMAYVPPQTWTIVYENEEGLMAGTIFPALDLPFKHGGMNK